MSFARLSVFVAAALSVVALAVVVAGPAMAHESWVLSPEEYAAALKQPPPAIFTQLTITNVLLVLVASVAVLGWILLGFTGARELFADLQARLASYGAIPALALRLGIGLMLFMAPFGLNPREGTPLFQEPVFLAPDLELRLLPGDWTWLIWAQAILSLMLIAGIYVRGAALGTIALCVGGLYLFPPNMLDYFGLVAGGAVYILLQGPGTYYVPMPSLPGSQRLVRFLADQPRERAQFIMRIMSGLCFIYLGITYKILQPNLMYAAATNAHIFTFGLPPGTFVFVCAIVETVVGVLIVAGVMIRAASVFLFLAFVFFSIAFWEGPVSHSFAYGILAAFVINGSGRWRRPVARDKAAKIVILGGGFAAVHAAMKLERLTGAYSNVEITLVHGESFFQFNPLLPEVVGGSVQPGNIVNPIRRICPRSRFVEGRVVQADPVARTVTVEQSWGESIVLDYDTLVVAAEREDRFDGVPGILEHGLSLSTLGDALHLRQCLIEALEEANATRDEGARRAMLTFAVIGGNARACATASEIRQLLDAALPSYPSLSPNDIRVVVLYSGTALAATYGTEISARVARRLSRQGIEIRTGAKVHAVTDSGVVTDGGRIACRTVVGTQMRWPGFLSDLARNTPDGRLPVDDNLRVDGTEAVFAAGSCAATDRDYAFLPLRETRMGRAAGYNAWAVSQGFAPRRWRERKPRLRIAALGRRASAGRAFGLPVGGRLAWVLSRLSCFATLPGLERNLRILIDWFLDLLFRNDIVVFAPQRSPRISRAHFEAGDVIIREGERGDCAYVIVSGRVTVTRRENGSDRTLAELSAGECFGEIALLADTPRTASVTCATAVDLTVIPREQFVALASGYRLLGDALHRQVQERRSQS